MTPLDNQNQSSSPVLQNELLPCPHCGETDIRVELTNHYGNVYCSECGAEVHAAVPRTIEEAKKRWNARSPAPDVQRLQQEKGEIDEWDEFHKWLPTCTRRHLIDNDSAYEGWTARATWFSGEKETQPDLQTARPTDGAQYSGDIIGEGFYRKARPGSFGRSEWLDLLLACQDGSVTCIRALEFIEREMNLQHPSISRMVEAFLAWPLPKSVCCDACVATTEFGAIQRVGTNLLTADEARQMFEHVLNSAQVASVPNGTDSSNATSVSSPNCVCKRGITDCPMHKTGHYKDSPSSSSAFKGLGAEKKRDLGEKKA